MKLEKDETYLITTDDWFIAPDGYQYKSVFGTFKTIHNDFETLGIKTSRGSANWFVEIGNMMIAGCQIHHVTRCNNFNEYPVKRSDPLFLDGSSNTKDRVNHLTSSLIYNSDKEYKHHVKK